MPLVIYFRWQLINLLIIIPFEVLTARERNILFQSQKRREEVSCWQEILQCNWSVCFREVLREKSDFFIYNCGLGGSLFTLCSRRAISHDERELRRQREKEGITRKAQRSASSVSGGYCTESLNWKFFEFLNLEIFWIFWIGSFRNFPNWKFFGFLNLEIFWIF